MYERREAVERAYQYTVPGQLQVEVHGKSKEKGYEKMIKERCLGEQLAKDKLETSLTS